MLLFVIVVRRVIGVRVNRGWFAGIRRFLVVLSLVFVVIGRVLLLVLWFVVWFVFVVCVVYACACAFINLYICMYVYIYTRVCAIHSQSTRCVSINRGLALF